jgi:hypothetical protein
MVRKNTLQSPLVMMIKDLTMSVPNFAEGQIRLGVGAAADTGKLGIELLKSGAGMAGIGDGGSPEITRRQLAVATMLASHAVLGAVGQMIYTAMVNGKPTMPNQLEDFIHPRTGRVRPDGTEERFRMPDPTRLWDSVLENPGSALYNRLNTIVRGAWETIDDKDWRGRQFRDEVKGPTDVEGMAKAAWEGIKHTAQLSAPIPLTQMGVVGTQKSTLDEKIGKWAGTQYSYTAGYSKAEALAYHILDTREGTPSKAQSDKMDLKASLVGQYRADPKSGADAIDKLRTAGQLTLADRVAIIKKANDKTGWVGTVNRFQMDDAMDVWRAAVSDGNKSDMEKLQPMLNNKMVNARTLSLNDFNAYWKEINGHAPTQDEIDNLKTEAKTERNEKAAATRSDHKAKAAASN